MSDAILSGAHQLFGAPPSPRLEQEAPFYYEPEHDAYAQVTGFGDYMDMRQPVQPSVPSVSVVVPKAPNTSLSASRVESGRASPSSQVPVSARSCRPSSASTAAPGAPVQQRPSSAPAQHRGQQALQQRQPPAALRHGQEAPPSPQPFNMVLQLGSRKPPPSMEGVRACGGSHSIAAGTQRQARQMAAVHHAQAQRARLLAAVGRSDQQQRAMARSRPTSAPATRKGQPPASSQFPTSSCDVQQPSSARTGTQDATSVVTVSAPQPFSAR